MKERLIWIDDLKRELGERKEECEEVAKMKIDVENKLIANEKEKN
jgi:hypothetical protein